MKEGYLNYTWGSTGCEKTEIIMDPLTPKCKNGCDEASTIDTNGHVGRIHVFESKILHFKFLNER